MSCSEGLRLLNFLHMFPVISVEALCVAALPMALLVAAGMTNGCRRRSTTPHWLIVFLMTTPFALLSKPWSSSWLVFLFVLVPSMIAAHSLLCSSACVHPRVGANFAAGLRLAGDFRMVLRLLFMLFTVLAQLLVALSCALAALT